ncbi:MAG: class I SAM-dependent methyltransferase [Chloroflexi bacterium]|nr:class I SAM-dependent methyltransferase [Chloroflexota bacterium]
MRGTQVTVFGEAYAGAYDALYHDKDYAAECDLIEGLCASYAQQPVKRILDLGCGTGGHAVVLAERGYQVVGVDRSADMLRLACERGSSARFQQGDITAVDLGETFDAALIMFAVLGYLTANADIQAALRAARRHLTADGLLVADVWYGPAVLAQRPSERVKVIDTPTGGRVIRAASSQLDTRRDVCTVDYHLWRLEDGKLTAEVCERHPVRYFFEPELQAFLASAGFELARIGGFPNLDEEPSERTWNVAFVARAR